MPYSLSPACDKWPWSQPLSSLSCSWSVSELAEHSLTFTLLFVGRAPSLEHLQVCQEDQPRVPAGFSCAILCGCLSPALSSNTILSTFVSLEVCENPIRSPVSHILALLPLCLGTQSWDVAAQFEGCPKVRRPSARQPSHRAGLAFLG